MSVKVDMAEELINSVRRVFKGDVFEAVKHLFEDPTDTSLLRYGYNIDGDHKGTTGNNTCKIHIWIIQGHNEIVAKFRFCNGRIEIKARESPNRWIEFEEDMVLTPNAKKGGATLKKRSNRRKTRKNRK